MNAYQSPLNYCASGYLSVGEIYMSYAVHANLELREKHTRVRYNVTQLWSGKQHKRVFSSFTYAYCLNIAAYLTSFTVFINLP